MKIIFFGSSEFSIKALEACLDGGHEVPLVVTTPDRKKGRGLKTFPTPVKTFSETRGIPCEAPENLKDEALIEKVKQLSPELFVVSAYGKFIPASWLTIPSRYPLNVHPSILPRYRGAAPMNWPILNGDPETGVSIIEVTQKMDAGDIFHQVRVPIDPQWDAGVLSGELATLSYQVLTFVLKQVAKNTEVRLPQSEVLVSQARKLTKEDGLIDWNREAVMILNQIRGLIPWPIAYTSDKGKPLQILKAHLGDASSVKGKPAEVLEVSGDGTFRVQTGKGNILVDRVRPAGRNEMSGSDYAHGRRMKQGYQFAS